MNPQEASLTKSLQDAIQLAFSIAKKENHEFITLEHLLLALSEDPLTQDAIEACGGSPQKLKAELKTFLKEKLEGLLLDPDQPSLHHPIPSLGFNRVMERAILHALSAESREVTSGDVLVALLQEEQSHAAYFLKSQGVMRLGLLRFLSHGAIGQVRQSSNDSPSAHLNAPETPDGEQEPAIDPLKAFAVDLIEKAAKGQIDPLIGRESELERMTHVLCRRRKNNPLLVGEAGVGKTALAEGLALRIHQNQVPDPLRNAAFYALDMGALMAGTRYRGDFEGRIKAVLEALRRQNNALLFIDEIHTLVGAGSVGGGSMDASNLLKPALQTGQLRCIGATTFQDHKASFDRDRALSRRFQTIEVGEPSEQETIQILKGLQGHYEAHHGVRFSKEAIEAAVTLSVRHLKDLHLPDKAIDVLDEAGAAQKLLPARKRKKVLGKAEIEAVVARMARVPVADLSGDDQTRLGKLEGELQKVIFGQDPAIDKVVSAIKLSRSGLRGPDKPTGSFLFAGPTGVGKTELARQLAQMLNVPFLRFDMSEYMEKHAVSRLIGAPPGYVGFDEGGLLVDAVRKSPHAVLLLDEIEKAHSDLFSILLQVMDHATLTDTHGRKADFRHIVLIMTSNAGARDLSQRKVGFSSSDTTAATSGARSAVEKAFSPEFRNRLDAIVYFAPLGHSEILKVVDKNIQELQKLLIEKGVYLELSQDAKEWLADKGFDPAFGARPMARLIDERIKKPLAEAILFGDLQKGGSVKIVKTGDTLTLKPPDRI